MKIGEGIYRNPTRVDMPPWSPFDDQFQIYASGEHPFSEAAISALRRYLPSNETEHELESGEESELTDPPIDAYSCDEFRIYEFKVRRCARGRSHDWTECPYAHPGEKARRRDPRKFHYSGVACPDFRKGGCKKGDTCEFAHGVFECWLHPARYRTQPCKDGTACRRRVCFFAHTPEQLRYLPHQQLQRMDSYDGSPMRLDNHFPKVLMSCSPTSTLISPPVSPHAESPPVSPIGSRVNDLLASMRKIQISKLKSIPSSWGGLMPSHGGVGFRSGFCSLPSTPGKTSAVVGMGLIDFDGYKDEPIERVESGRALRAKMYERLSKDSGFERPDDGSGPDVGWVSELIK